MAISPRAKANLTLILLTLVWGSSFPLVKMALQESGIFTFLSLRFTLAALFILPFLRLKDRPVLLKLKIPGLVLGSAIFLGFALQSWGLTLTSASKSGFITGTLVVMVPFLAKPILGSPLKSRQLLAALMSLTGVYFLNPNKIDNINPGDILTLFCALAFALHLVYLQKFSRIEISLPLTLFQIVMVAMLALPLGIFAEGLRGIDSWKVWGLAVYLALFCTALAYWIQTRFQPQTQPHTAAVIYMLEPVFAAFFAYLILSEAPPNLLGAGLILVSMMIAEW